MRGGSTHQKTIPPRGGGCPHPPRRSPKKHHPGGVNTNEQGAVFHPLNGSGARGTTSRSNPGRRPIGRYPKGFHPRNNISAQAIYPVVPHHPKISTGLPFLFRSPEPLFLLRCKRKSGFGPCRAGKKQLQDKTHHFPTKEKTVLPAPPIRRHSRPAGRQNREGAPFAVEKRTCKALPSDEYCLPHKGYGSCWEDGFPRKGRKSQKGHPTYSNKKPPANAGGLCCP